LTINPALSLASSIQVSAASPQKVGVAFPVTITAKTSLGTPYNGTVTLTCSDGENVAPQPILLAGGTYTTNITLNKAGTFKLTATSGTATGSSNLITVNAGSPASILVSAPFTATVGTAFNVTITVLDQAGNPATFKGSVTLTCSSGPMVSAPITVTLTNGTANSSVTLMDPGQLTLIATANTSTGTISGTSGVINVGTTAAANLAQKLINFGLDNLGKPEAAPALVALYNKYLKSLPPGTKPDPAKNPYTCADFVDYALTQVGAKSGLSGFGVSGTSTNLDYIWGKLTLQYNAADPLSQLDQVQPGEIIQFQDVSTTITQPNGAWNSDAYPHHTAIVEQNLGGGRFLVLQQNYPEGTSHVTEDIVNLSGMSSGTIWFYQPVPANP